MAIFHISFQLDGKNHSISAESNYPTKELIEKKEVSELIVEENAFQIIKTYMIQHKLKGPINPETVVYNYEM